MSAKLPALTKLKPNPHWARLPLFNRKNWSRVRFGDVAENVNERVEPSTAAEETKNQVPQNSRSYGLGRRYAGCISQTRVAVQRSRSQSTLA